MTAVQIHLASLECWQRVHSRRINATAFLVLQTLAAATTDAEMRTASLQKTTGMKLNTIYSSLHLLARHDLVSLTRARCIGTKGTPPLLVRMTAAGTQLMSPKEAQHDPSTLNPWRHSTL